MEMRKQYDEAEEMMDEDLRTETQRSEFFFFLLVFFHYLTTILFLHRALERIEARAVERERDREDEFQENGPEVKICRAGIAYILDRDLGLILRLGSGFCSGRRRFPGISWIQTITQVTSAPAITRRTLWCRRWRCSIHPAASASHPAGLSST
jgi:hypothetical protein